MRGPQSRLLYTIGIGGGILHIFYVASTSSCDAFGFAPPSVPARPPLASLGRHRQRQPTALHQARGTTDLMTKRWFFPTSSSKEDVKDDTIRIGDELTELERKCLRYAGDLIRSRMG